MNQTFLKVFITCMGISVLLVGTLTSAFAQSPQTSQELDAKVEKFLNENRGHWHDWNVPYEDGKVLYNLIIKNNGQVETAEQQFAEMLRLKGEGFNIGRQMIGWVLYDNGQVDVRVRKFGLQNTKNWLSSAVNDFSERVKKAFPNSYRLKIDVWESISNGEDQADQVANLNAYYNANKFSIMYINTPNAVALIGLVLSVGLALVNILALIGTAAALGFLVFNVLRANKSYPARIEEAVKNLIETMEQITEFRRYYRAESDKREEIVGALNFI